VTHDSELREALDLLAAPAAAHAPDWPSIARRSRRAARHRLLLTIATILLAIAVTAPALGVDDRLLGLVSGDPIEEESLSTHDLVCAQPRQPRRTSDARLGAVAGAPNAEGMLRNLGDLGVNEVRLLAEREGRAFYVVGYSAPTATRSGRQSHMRDLGASRVFAGQTAFRPARADL
jgi:hypothetical protein